MPPISYSHKSMVGVKPEDKQDLLKVYINTQLGEANSDTILLYVQIFNTWSYEVILKLLTHPKKIINGQSLTTAPHRYATNNNILVG